MPELPEVQAHAERLTDTFAGAVLERFAPITFTALKTFDPDPAAAHGRALGQVRRRGKLAIMDFGDLSFVVHLMQGGRLTEDRKQSRKPRNGVARWRFADGRALLLTEAGTERKAGVWVRQGDPLAQEPLDELGPEADTVEATQMHELLSAESTRLHGFLRDQRRIAGLGRRLANEVCHRAQLSPFASTAKLDGEAAGRLVEAISDAVEEGLSFDGDRDRMSSSAERPGNVHHRTGEACPACGETIREVSYRSYTVHYCPGCQTGGKVLADNTTSRFLK